MVDTNTREQELLEKIERLESTNKNLEAKLEVLLDSIDDQQAEHEQRLQELNDDILLRIDNAEGLRNIIVRSYQLDPAATEYELLKLGLGEWCATLRVDAAMGRMWTDASARGVG